MSSSAPCRSIPCLYLPCQTQDSDDLVILFHGNGEDLGSMFTMADHICLSLKVNVVVLEYPGYGIYRAHDRQIECSAETILEDALSVFNFFTSTSPSTSSPPPFQSDDQLADARNQSHNNNDIPPPHGSRSRYFERDIGGHYEQYH